MIVCHCRAVTSSAVQRQVASGAEDIQALKASCGAGDQCGGCLPALHRLLDELALAPPVPTVLAGA
jgi:bacterioferritin-associated ferredoxin